MGESEAGVEERYEGENYIRFDYPYVGHIIDGEKDATIRLGLDRDFEVGQTIQLRTPGNNLFGYAEIEDIYESRVAAAWFDTVMVDGRSYPEHSEQTLLKSLREHYPDQEIGMDTPVTVVYFDLVQVGQRRNVRPLTTETAPGAQP